MKFNNTVKTLAVLLLLVIVSLAGLQTVAAESGTRLLAQDAGVDLPGYESTEDVTNSIGFTADIYLCDEDGWAVGEPRSVFAADEEFCLMGVFNSGSSDQVRSVVAEWEDGFGHIQTSLGRDMTKGLKMHWSFSYDNPTNISPNVGKITVKDYDTCEVLGIYPIEINDQDTLKPVFIGGTYRCHDDLSPNLDEPTVTFMADEKVCISGELINLGSGETRDVQFVWEDGLDYITTVDYDDVKPGDEMNVYYYYETPDQVASNSGWITVKDKSTDEWYANMRLNFINVDEFPDGQPEPLGFSGALYRCDGDNYATGNPTENFKLDENFCLTGNVIGANENWSSNLVFDWEDGQDNSTLLIGKDYIPGTVVNWYYYYYNPAMQQKNKGEVIVKDYDTCQILNRYPVNMGFETKFDAGTGL